VVREKFVRNVEAIACYGEEVKIHGRGSAPIVDVRMVGWLFVFHYLLGRFKAASNLIRRCSWFLRMSFST